MPSRIFNVIFLSSFAIVEIFRPVSSLSFNGPQKLELKKCSRRDAFASLMIAPFVACQVQEVEAAVDLSGFQDGPRGLKYLVTKEGEGEPPVRAQKVSAKYTLTVNGFAEDAGSEKIDSNTGFLGQPFSVPVGVGMVVKGWDLTLIDMKKGEARRLVIPPELGYGEKGAGGKIPPNTTLYFEMEVVDIGAPPQLKPEQEKWLEEHPI